MGLHVNETLLKDPAYKKAAQKELKDFMGFVNSVMEGKNSDSKSRAFFDLCTGKKDTVTYLNANDEEVTLSFKALKTDKISTVNMTRGQIVNDVFNAFGDSVEEVNEKLGLYSEKQLEKDEFYIHYTMLHGQISAPSSKINIGVEFSEAEIAENQKEIAENSFGMEFSSEREVNGKSVKTLLNDVKNKTTEYNKINLFRRALSYINPFKDSVREMRKDISETKEFLTQNGIDKGQLEDFINGKADIDSVNLNNVEQVEEFDSRSTLNAEETKSKWPVDDEVEKSMEVDAPVESEQFIEMNKDVEVVLGDDVNLE